MVDALRLITAVVRWNLRQLELDSKRWSLALQQPTADALELARGWLPAVLEEASRLHPGASLELVVADRAAELTSDTPPTTLPISLGAIPHTPGMCDRTHDLCWRDAFLQLRPEVLRHPIASRDPKFAASLLLAAAALSVYYNIANPETRPMVVVVPNHLVPDLVVDDTVATDFSTAMAPQALMLCPVYKLALRLAFNRAVTRLKELTGILTKPTKAPIEVRADFKYLLFFLQGQQKTSRDSGPDADTYYVDRLLHLMAKLGYRDALAAWSVMRAAGIHDRMEREAVYELTNHGQVRFSTYLCLALRGLGLLNVTLFQSIVSEAEQANVARRLFAFGMAYDEVAAVCGVLLPARFKEPS